MMKQPNPSQSKLFRQNYKQHGMCYPFLVENAVEAMSWFGRAFHDAAHHEMAELQKYNFPDDAALPALYLFRHAAELYLKGIVWNADEVLLFLKKPTSGAPTPTKATHRLSSWLPFVEHVLKELGLAWNEGKFGPYANAVAVLKELDQVDEGSYSFRYPIDRLGKPSQPHSFGFNILDFAKTLDPVLEGLWDLAGDIENAREYHMMA